MKPEDRAFLRWQAAWCSTARPEQIPPDGDWTECGVLAGRGFGKALALDTPIATTHGWTTMGEIRDGDEVFDENGYPCVVEKAHEVLLGRECFAVRFDDGSEIVADGDHLGLRCPVPTAGRNARRK